MFTKGQAVICIDAGTGAELKKGETYHVAEYYPPEQFPSDSLAGWAENGGCVELVEHPMMQWYGRRFQSCSEPHRVSEPSGEPWCPKCNRPESRCLCQKSEGGQSG